MALALAAVGVTAFVSGLYFFERFDPRHSPKKQVASETHEQTPPVSPAPSTPVNIRQDPRPVVNAANVRNDDETATPTKHPPQSRSIIVARDPAIDRWFIKSYLRCWTPPATLPSDGKYGAQIRVVHNVDGSLTGAPTLVNRPTDPAWRAYANSAVRAVTKCNPLQIPPQYLAHFEQWRKMTLHFSPDSALE